MENDVRIKLHSPMSIQIVTEDVDYVKLMKEEFTAYVEGFRFMPAYKSGGWNGQVCMMHKFHHTLPYGLLFDLIKIHKKECPRTKLSIDPEVKSLFNIDYLKPTYNLKHYPYPYQEDCINAALKTSKGIIRSATASGKSLVISYIVKTLIENSTNKIIIVVPSVQLVSQFYDDMMEYGMDKLFIGRVYSKKKEWDKPVVISTWQTLSKNLMRVPDYHAIIVDEVHGAKAHELKKILSKSENAKYRLGFTGTMPGGTLDDWNVKAYLGPIMREYSSGLLAEQGYISKCNIKMLNIEYHQEEWEGTYDDVKDEMFRKDYRLKLIGNLVESLDHNILVLTGKVEKEGEYLEDYLNEYIAEKDIGFISGRDDVEVREKWRKKCGKKKNIILIATYGIFQQGINIPNLKYILLASPFKSKVRVLQSVGRALRKHTSKVEGAVVFDIHDHTRFFHQHGNLRLRHYDAEKFNVDEYLFEEGSTIEINQLFSDV